MGWSSIIILDLPIISLANLGAFRFELEPPVVLPDDLGTDLLLVRSI